MVSHITFHWPPEFLVLLTYIKERKGVGWVGWSHRIGLDCCGLSQRRGTDGLELVTETTLACRNDVDLSGEACRIG